MGMMLYVADMVARYHYAQIMAFNLSEDAYEIKSTKNDYLQLEHSMMEKARKTRST